MQREQKKHERDIIGTANAVCDPVAVMVHPDDATIAKATVLAACWFRDLAGAADVAWVKDNVVIWVEAT